MSAVDQVPSKQLVLAPDDVEPPVVEGALIQEMEEYCLVHGGEAQGCNSLIVAYQPLICSCSLSIYAAAPIEFPVNGVLQELNGMEVNVGNGFDYQGCASTVNY